MKSIIVIFLILMTTSSFAQTKAAIVKILRGEVDVLTLGKTTKLKMDDWVEAGSIVKTGEKSFVRLIFVDKSTMNISANSEMKIESFTGKDAGVIDLVKGKIRSQVTKDYLQIKDKDKSKMFIKTQNAVMGVRGTDFEIATNGINTATVLFEGEIAFNKLSDRGSLSSERLEQIVDSGVRMFPGEFSVVDQNRTMPTVPALLNIQQREALEKNTDMNSDRTPSNTTETSAKSVVPEGLSGAVVSNNSETLKSEVGQVMTGGTPEAAVQGSAAPSAAASDPQGYVKGNLVKPANGSFVHLESGVIIPPDSKAVLDANTNTFIPGAESGTVASDGSYIPPKNVEITNDGKILVATRDSTGAVVVKEVPPPPPVVTASNTPIGAQIVANAGPTGPAPAGGTTADPRRADIPPPQGGLDNRFNTSGGITNVNDPTRQSSLIDTTIIVKPNTNN